MNRAPASAVFLVILAVVSAKAQTSSLAGFATAQSIPVAGIVVTVTSPALQGSRSTMTSPNGAYSFATLPPGQYTVTFELAGIAEATRRVHLALSMTTTLDVDMNTSFSAAITVENDTGVRTSAPGGAVSLRASEIDLLPAGRDVLSAALFATGVTTKTAGSASQLVMSGGPGYDNLIMVDGAVIMNSDGNVHSLFIEDAIQETTVLTNGISAEFGRFTGGVINTLTKSGGNRWRGSLRDGVSSPSWTAKTPYPVVTARVTSVDHVFEETLGGFIMKDRLWFFLAARQSRNRIPRLTELKIPFVATLTESRYDGKATASTTRSTLVASLLNLHNEANNITFNRIYDVASLFNATFPQSILSIRYEGMFDKAVLIEGQFSRKRFAAEANGSPFTDIIRGTPIVNQVNGTRFNSATNCGVCGARRTYNRSGAVTGRAFIPASYGAHSIVTGAEQFGEQRRINNYPSGSGYTVFASSVLQEGANIYPVMAGNGRAFIRWTPLGRESSGNDLATWSAFANDEWQINSRLNANVGLRYDRNRARDTDGSIVSRDAAFSPRLGVIYDLTENGRHSLSGGYAQYVSNIKDGRIGGAGESAGVPSQIDFAYLGPAINPPGTPADRLVTPAEALRRVFDWFRSQCDPAGHCAESNLLLLLPNGLREIPGFSTRIGAGLASPRVTEYYAGYGTQLGRQLSVKVNAIRRVWSSFYNYRVDATTPRERDSLNIDHDIAIVENTNSIERKYRGAQLQAQWRPSRVRGGAAYTWSALRGNDEQESQESRAIPNAARNTYYPEFLSYANRSPVGYLSQDQRHRGLAWLGYDVPLRGKRNNLSVSIVQTFESGRRYSARALIKTTGYAGSPAVTAYRGGVPDAMYYFSKRGAFRLDNVSQTDLALVYRRTLKGSEFFLHADLLNAFDRSTIIAVDTTVLTAVTQGNLQSFNPFLDEPVRGVHYRLADQFGRPRGPESYQQPRSYQFSARLRF